MSRKFLAVCALALAVVMALAGCNLVKVDEAMDAATVVARFNGGTVTKGEVEPTYAYYVNYYNTLSSLYGYTISTDGLLENVTEQAVQTKVLLNKAEELGLTALTDEEEEALRADAQTNYEDTVQQVWDSFAEEDLTDEEIRADVVAYLDESGYTLDSAYDDLREQKLVDKVREHVYGEVSVTPEEVQDRYNEKVAQDEARYADAATFESAVTTEGTTIAWYPEGYRTVKQILVSFPEDIQTRISDIDTEISNLQADMDEVNAALAEKGEGEEETGEETAQTREELVADYTAQIADKQAEREAALAEGMAAIQETVDTILERLEAGEDFQALLDEYNEDSGMQSEPAASVGYYVSAASTQWIDEFRDAAMALAAIGDVSEPVASRFGAHIIRYESDVTSGAVPYDELKDTIEAEVLSEKQSETYESSVAAWVDAAQVQYDYSSFN